MSTGIGIYTAADPSALVSIGGVFTNPVNTVLDGKNGSVIKQRLYVRNSDSTLSYTGIVLTPISSGSIGVDGSSGNLSIKLSEGNSDITEDQWSAKTAGASVTLSNNLGSASASDISKYLPFWVRIECPHNMAIQTILDIALQVDATELLVP